MKLKTGQKCAFGFGAFGKDIVYMLIASYLLYYYNVVLGMSSVFIGTVMMAARIFDAFNDPVMGIIVAKTRTRWGRFKPWIFAGTVCLKRYNLLRAMLSERHSCLTELLSQGL